MSELQILTDSLAERIRRPVTIDDPEMRLLTHSAQAGDIDDGRLASILHRRVPEKVVAWLRSLRIADATGPVRIALNTELGTLARICVPIRWHDTLLGYLWVIDSDSSLTGDDIAVASSAAETAGNVLYRELLREQLERGRERELLRDLLSEQVDFRRYAADELVKGDLFVPGAGCCALVARPLLVGRKIWDDDLQLEVGRALEQMRRSRPPRRSLQLVRPDHALFVVSVSHWQRGPAEALTLGRWLHSMLTERLADLGIERLMVGIGEAQSSLVEVVHSYHQAQQAARVAEIVASLGPVLEWARLGIYQILSHFPVERLTADVLPSGLIKLLEHPGRGWLVETLERYLDNAGDVQATASSLALHRASLYYRLQRIEEISSLDLRSGEDRLALHLGLKLAHLAGFFPDSRGKTPLATLVE